jgi:spoIIIJ-associated protein
MDGRSRDARQSADFSARTVAEAVAKAAEELGVPADQLNYRVIKDSHSILWLVRTGEAVIRVFMPESAPGPEPAVESNAAVEATEMSPTAAPLATEPEAVMAEELAEEPVAAEQLEEEDEEEEAATAHGGLPPELASVATEVVATVLDKMGLIAAVEVADRGGTVDPVTKEVSPLSLNIVGDDLGVLIGRRGETLRDLQFIVRLIVSRRLGQWPNLVLDVEGYKARRASSLQALAQRMADQVRETRQPAILEPMPAHERRIIHLTLRDDPDVYTESTGEDEGRKVQILPK